MIKQLDSIYNITLEDQTINRALANISTIANSNFRIISSLNIAYQIIDPNPDSDSQIDSIAYANPLRPNIVSKTKRNDNFIPVGFFANPVVIAADPSKIVVSTLYHHSPLIKQFRSYTTVNGIISEKQSNDNSKTIIKGIADGIGLINVFEL